MNDQKNAPFVVIGGGIGGALTALLLGECGQPVILCEKRTSLKALAYGLQLTPNAARLLEHISFKAELEAIAHQPKGLTITRPRKNHPLRRLELGAPYYTLSRQALMSMIIDRLTHLKHVDIRTDCHVTDWHRDNDLFTVRTKCHAPLSAKAIVYAGGIHAPPVSEGLDVSPTIILPKVAFRTKVKSKTHQNYNQDIQLFINDHGHSLIYPMDKNGDINVVIIQKTEPEQQLERFLVNSDRFNGQEARQSKDFERLNSSIKSENALAGPDIVNNLPNGLVRALDLEKAHWSTWPLLMKAPGGWRSGVGAVTMLGDVAHAMPPFLAQGAAMAIEDAFALVHAVKTAPDLNQAFRYFEVLRRPRVKAVQKASINQEKRYFIRPWLRPFRDTALALAPQILLTREAQRLFDYDIVSVCKH